MELQGSILTVPGPKDGSPDRALDLGDILVAENRQNEVAVVTPMKAPELLSLFNAAWRDVDRIVKQLTADKLVAEKMVTRRRSELLLDEVEDILKAKGVSSTKDTRDAVIALDTKYQAAEERLDQLTAACEYLKGKLKSFENAFSSVKKIMGEDTYNMSGRIGNPALRGDATPGRPEHRPAPGPRVNPAAVAKSDEPLPFDNGRVGPAVVKQIAPKATSGFGKPRYDRQ